MSCDIFEIVCSAFQQNEQVYPQNVYDDLKHEVEARRGPSVEERDYINKPNMCLRRNFSAESFISKSAQEGNI
jgi:hypothetical protein